MNLTQPDKYSKKQPESCKSRILAVFLYVPEVIRTPDLPLRSSVESLLSLSKYIKKMQGNQGFFIGQVSTICKQNQTK